jgi:hypothetical protein
MTVIIDGVEYLSATAAARQLATTETKILMLLKQQLLCGELIEGEWFVTKASFDGYDPLSCQPEQELACRASCTSSGCGCH